MEGGFDGSHHHAPTISDNIKISTLGSMGIVGDYNANKYGDVRFYFSL